MKIARQNVNGTQTEPSMKLRQNCRLDIYIRNIARTKKVCAWPPSSTHYCHHHHLRRCCHDKQHECIDEERLYGLVCHYMGLPKRGTDGNWCKRRTRFSELHSSSIIGKQENGKICFFLLQSIHLSQENSAKGKRLNKVYLAALIIYHCYFYVLVMTMIMNILYEG